MHDRVRITDVSPRDGLQNEPLVNGAPVPTIAKIALIAALADAGVDEIEATSFVNPKLIPQLADAADVLLGVAEVRARRPRFPVLSLLVPNARGMESAVGVQARARDAYGVPAFDKVALFTAASETFARKNVNASIAETLERFRPVIETARGLDMPVRGYVSCAIACPYEGPIAPERVADVSLALLALGGIGELDLGDTIGVATPETLTAMLDVVMDRVGAQFPDVLITLHLHDTFGRAADCVKAGAALGIRSFDGSAGGIGGCPFASTPGRRAPGNIATATLVRACRQLGLSTGLDLDRLEDATRLALTSLGRTGGLS